MIVKEENSFEIAPAGTFKGICVDVVDMGLKDTPYGRKHKLRIAWEINENMSDGRPFLAMGFYTASLSEKANLRKDLEAWRGKPFTFEELKGFDMDAVVGKSCMLSIIHNESGGKTYANISSISPLMKDMDPLTPSGEYTRVKDREEKPVQNEDKPPNHPDNSGGHEIHDDDIPGKIDDSKIPF